MNIISIILLPFLILLVGATMAGCFALGVYMGDWYAAGATPAIDSAWYAWLWSWPGVELAHRYIGSHPATELATTSLNVFSNWSLKVHNFIGAVIALAINVTVALAPLTAFVIGRRVWNSSKQTDHTDSIIKP
jgi:hypothetical protein